MNVEIEPNWPTAQRTARAGIWSSPPVAARSRQASTPSASGLHRKGLHQGRHALPDERAWHLAIGDVITLGRPGHPQLGTCRRPKVVAAERIAGLRHVDRLRPRAGLHLLRSSDRSVGLTEREARERGFDVRVGTFPSASSGRAENGGAKPTLRQDRCRQKYDEVLAHHDRAALDRSSWPRRHSRLPARVHGRRLIRTIHAHPTNGGSRGEAAHAVHGAAIHL